MNNRRFKGFTLVELLVSLALSSIIILAVTATFASAVKAGKTQMDVTNKLENEMLFEQMIKRDMQNIDAWKCHSKKQDFPTILGITNVFKQHNANATWGQNNVTQGAKLIKGSDTLYLLSTEKMPLNKAAVGANTIELAAANIRKKDMLLVTDCASVKFYQVEAVKTNNKSSVELTLDSILPKELVGVKIQVYKIVLKHYSLRKGRNNTAVYLSINNKPAFELLSNISSLQIEYAVDSVSAKGHFLQRDFYNAEEMDALQLWQKLRQVVILIKSSAATNNTFEFSFLLSDKG